MARKNRRERRAETFVKAVHINQVAAVEGPTKKRWSLHDLKTIQPITTNQSVMFDSYLDTEDTVIAYGSPGSGKTLLALYLAMLDVLDNRTPYDRIIIVRSAVATRDQGFLKGTLEEKESVYATPYRDLLGFLFGKQSTFDNMKAAGLVEFMTTSYVRGISWDNAIVVIDEFQNTTLDEFSSVATRLGKHSRLVVCGDVGQNDLTKSNRDSSGAPGVLRIFESMDNVSMIKFTHDDIVRSGFVKEWIMAKEKMGF